MGQIADYKSPCPAIVRFLGIRAWHPLTLMPEVKLFQNNKKKLET